MTLYHVTFQKNIPKILYHGILPNKGRVWRNYFGEKIGKGGVVFAWDNWDRAYRWAYKQWWEFRFKPTAVIQFVIGRKYVSIVPTSMYGNEYMVSGKVYPEQIRDVFVFDWRKP
jgi:hypothetical protein